jgi:hypothetical protein
MRGVFGMTLFLACSSLPAQVRLLQPEDLRARDTAAALLEFGLGTWRDLPVAAGEERLLGALATAALCLPAGSAARARADELRASCRSHGALAASAADLLADLRFRPVVEAELPRGVPGFQVLDELELRHYPAYRMVRASLRPGAIAAFWPLFRHIQERDIAMTTPVQMDWRADGANAATMAFLYGSPALGPTGAAGGVEVVDQPATTVLTIGSRGYDRPARIAELRARIAAWLDDHPEWAVAGPLRTMNYNSPSVGAERRCFEVQQPLRPRTPAAVRQGSV